MTEQEFLNKINKEVGTEFDTIDRLIEGMIWAKEWIERARPIVRDFDNQNAMM